MRQLVVCSLALFAISLSACSSKTSSIPPTNESPMNALDAQSVSPFALSGPLHIHGAMAWYQGEGLNKDIPATWMAQHYDMTEQGDAGGTYANAFMAAGGKYAIAYSDPEIMPGCFSPFATANGAKPGTCTGTFAGALNGTESAWLHDSSGNRLHVTANGTQVNGQWQDRDNPNYSGLPSAYRAYENTVIVGTRTNAFEIDDIQSQYIPSYFGFKFGATSREFNALGSSANATWLAAQERIIAAAPKPVLLNGIVTSGSTALITQPNVLGVMLESCASTNNTVGIVGSVWVANMNELLLITNSLHKDAVCVNYGTTVTGGTTARVYALASWWLTYNPTYSVNLIDIPTSDGHEVYPEHGIAVSSPLTTATSSIATLHTSTGVYLREFSSCTVSGVAIGACAAEVNSDAVTHSVPATHFKYGHYLVLSTKSWYLGGTVSWAAGTFTTLPAHSARILKV